ncbi:alpha/beta fold hydrolase [Sphingomonas sp. SRS2]|uniref:alpha/beta fold hydrolase n=1 Tax=Sphingomonas sp. SRS2 TaxID=133190 RepID=UPI00061845EE|nr:alpha/beta hydrolase [Sphingomonas sp. SRS2]KKC26203.1 alpha/beta hydrolase [Sphingomonas sp. SRS2]
MSPRTRTVMSGRMKLNIVEWGDPSAPPLILQHGGRDHARSWDAVAAAFAADHYIIAPDLRGHGDSDWASDGSYDFFDFVQDFVGIADALDLPPCAIIGHSLGGNIVTRFAGLFPDRVTRLVNIEGLGWSPEVVAEREKRDEIERFRDIIETRAKFAGRTPRRFPDFAALTARMRASDVRLSDEQAEHLARHAARADGDGFVIKHDPAAYDVSAFDISQHAKQRLWGAIACPVLLGYGAQSWASNPATDGRAAHFRHARVELFEDAGHWVHHDRPEDFIATVRGFLAD